MSTPAAEYAHDLFDGAVWYPLTAEQVHHWTRAVETPQGLAWFAEAVATAMEHENLAQWALRNAAARRRYAECVGPNAGVTPDVMRLTCEAVHTAARSEVRRRRLQLWPDVRAWAEHENRRSRCAYGRAEWLGGQHANA